MLRYFYLVVVLTSAALAIGSLCLGLLTHDTTKKVVLALWTLGPPIWFQFEWEILRGEIRGKEGPEFTKWFEQFKYSQELASKVWLAVVSVLLAIFYGEKFFKG